MSEIIQKTLMRQWAKVSADWICDRIKALLSVCEM